MGGALSPHCSLLWPLTYSLDDWKDAFLRRSFGHGLTTWQLSCQTTVANWAPFNYSSWSSNGSRGFGLTSRKRSSFHSGRPGTTESVTSLFLKHLDGEASRL